MIFRQAMLALALFTAGVAANAQTVIVHAGQLLDRPELASRGAATLLIRDGKVEQVRDGHRGADSFADAGEASVIGLRGYFALPG